MFKERYGGLYGDRSHDSRIEQDPCSIERRSQQQDPGPLSHAP